jgi:hypothetical protein
VAHTSPKVGKQIATGRKIFPLKCRCGREGPGNAEERPGARWPSRMAKAKMKPGCGRSASGFVFSRLSRPPFSRECGKPSYSLPRSGHSSPFLVAVCPNAPSATDNFPACYHRGNEYSKTILSHRQPKLPFLRDGLSKDQRTLRGCNACHFPDLTSTRCFRLLATLCSHCRTTPRPRRRAPRASRSNRSGRSLQLRTSLRRGLESLVHVPGSGAHRCPLSGIENKANA